MLCSNTTIYTVLNFFIKRNDCHSQISNATNPKTLLAVFTRVREAGRTNISFVTSVDVEDIRSGWTNFREVFYWVDFTKICRENSCPNTDKNNRHFTFIPTYFYYCFGNHSTMVAVDSKRQR